MVLTLKRWKSRSSPGIKADGTKNPFTVSGPSSPTLEGPQKGPFCVPGSAQSQRAPSRPKSLAGWSSRQTVRSREPTTRSGLTSAHHGDAGWSSPVARQAHNLKVAGSNPAPATRQSRKPNELTAFLFAEIGSKIRPRIISVSLQRKS